MSTETQKEQVIDTDATAAAATAANKTEEEEEDNAEQQDFKIIKQIHESYQTILERSADKYGLEMALKNIKNGDITIFDLQWSLKQSDEYKRITVYKEKAKQLRDRVILYAKSLVNVSSSMHNPTQLHVGVQ